MAERESDSDSPRRCPYLGLASDPSISCSFLTSSHRCFRWPTPKPVDDRQQRDYCLSPTFKGCSWFVSANGDPDRGRGLSLPTGYAGPLSLVALILVVGLILIFFKPWSLLLPATSEAGKLAPAAAPVVTSTPAAQLPVYPSPIVPSESPWASPQPQVPAASPSPARPTDEGANAIATSPPAATPSTAATAGPSAVSGSAPESVAVKVYTVKKGDNLYSLARTFGTTVNDLVKANNLADRGSLRVGQTLVIPPATH